MAYFPLFIQLEGCRCLVIGGGKVALRKCQALSGFGAQIFVAAKEACTELTDFASSHPSVTLFLRPAKVTDAEGMTLVICASDDEAFHKEMADYCRARRILVNTADDRENCTFFFPAIVRQEDVVIGISTGGSSPAAAKYLRQFLQNEIPEYFGSLVKRLGSFRSLVQASLPLPCQRERLFTQLLEDGIARKGALTGEFMKAKLEQAIQHARQPASNRNLQERELKR